MTREEYVELVLSKYRQALVSCPRAGTGAHSWALATANFAAKAGVDRLTAVHEITAAMSRPPRPAREVEMAVDKAYAEVEPIGGRGGASGRSGAAGGVLPPVVRAARPGPAPRAAARLIEIGEGVGSVDWLGESPVRIDWEPGSRDATAVLRTLYGEDEFLFCGGAYDTGVRPVGEWVEIFERGVAVPPHVIPNPMDGQAHSIKAGGEEKKSFRCDAAVSAFRFAVAEMDEMPLADQVAFWWGWRFEVPAVPIAALIYSGGKSVHAWLRVDVRGRSAWEADVEDGLFRDFLVPLGCDRACRNESRLSRLPGHFRTDKKKWQRLIYLDGGFER